MKKTVVILAHPNLKNSIANKTILNEVKKLENIEIRNLYALYPDFDIDIQAEQKILLQANLIIYQHPFYWYSMPALLKEWQDRVFSYGFAFGPTGEKLKNKDFVVSLTIGGPKESYNKKGYNNFTIKQLLRPYEQTATLCGMKYHKPVKSYGMIFIPGVYNTHESVKKRALQHAQKLKKFILKHQTHYYEKYY